MEEKTYDNRLHTITLSVPSNIEKTTHINTSSNNAYKKGTV